jgi:hypothetical protein
VSTNVSSEECASPVLTPAGLAGYLQECVLTLPAGPPIQLFCVYIPPDDAQLAAAVRAHVLLRRKALAPRHAVGIVGGDFNGALYQHDRGPQAMPCATTAARDRTHAAFVLALGASPVDGGAARSPSFLPEGADVARHARLDDILWCPAAAAPPGGAATGTLRVLSHREHLHTSDHAPVRADIDLAPIGACLPGTGGASDAPPAPRSKLPRDLSPEERAVLSAALAREFAQRGAAMDAAVRDGTVQEAAVEVVNLLQAGVSAASEELGWDRPTNAHGPWLPRVLSRRRHEQLLDISCLAEARRLIWHSIGVSQSLVAAARELASRASLADTLETLQDLAYAMRPGGIGPYTAQDSGAAAVEQARKAAHACIRSLSSKAAAHKSRRLRQELRHLLWRRGPRGDV